MGQDSEFKWKKVAEKGSMQSAHRGNYRGDGDTSKQRLPSKEDTRVAEHEVRVQGPSGQSRLFHGHLSEDAREEGEIVPEGKSLMPLPSQEFQAQLERTQTVGKKVISDTVDAEEGLQMVKGLVEDQSAAANDHIMEWDEIRATFLEHGIDMDAADDLHDVSEMEVEEESMGQEEEKINQVDEMQHVTDGEKGQGVGDAALKQGAKKKQSKLMVTTAASTKMRTANSFVSPQKRAAARISSRYGETSKQREKKGTSNPSSDHSKT
ncbi:uncharacterized protein LOC106430845 [Brassica napus]|uniref:uncharacterized protein LOC106430845 n=1 Tax=Brassica napus TaxID=3708 RepID=UPI0006AB1858|nr:uncharacterized protein LOC106430845 [Brassica napus]